jgi:hypothetical protein
MEYRGPAGDVARNPLIHRKDDDSSVDRKVPLRGDKVFHWKNTTRNTKGSKKLG